MFATNKNIKTLSTKQHGVVLFICLIFLLVMTLLAITSLDSSALEEKKAGNTLDRQLAFQAAEAALRAGEVFIDLNTPTLDDDCTNGICVNPRSQAAAIKDIGWQEDPTHALWTDEAQTADIVLAGVRTTARFMIEDMCEIPIPGGITPTERMFRITALASGGSDQSIVMLQSAYVVPNNYGTSPNCDCSDVSYCDGTCTNINCTPPAGP